jgi:hypothetical protein
LLHLESSREFFAAFTNTHCYRNTRGARAHRFDGKKRVRIDGRFQDTWADLDFFRGCLCGRHFDGFHHYDELCCMFGISYETLDEMASDAKILWKRADGAT